MAKIRCFLCGGRVSGGTCTECGMPQRQHAQNYYLNESKCDNKPLTHVHDEYDKSRNRDTYANREHRKEQRKQSGKFPLKAIAAIIVILCLLASVGAILAGVRSVNSAVKDILEDFDAFEIIEEYPTEEIFSEEYKDIPEDAYAFVNYELTETNVFHDDTLLAGNYIVGYHIPEGVYSIALEEGYGTMELDDSNQAIYLYEYMDYTHEDGPSIIYNLRLYDGAVLRLTGDGEFYLTTDHAGVTKELKKNTQEEIFVVGTDPIQAGVDFPAGTYDFILRGDLDYISTFILDNQGNESYYWSYLIKGDDVDEYDNEYGDYANRICNINIEAGTYVHIDNVGNVLELVPSEYVAPQEGEQDGEYY